MTPNETLTYRMNEAGFAWHFHKECNQYPHADYAEIKLEEPEDYMMVCVKCKKLQESFETKISA